MKTTRALAATVALVLAAAGAGCGTKGPLVLPEADAAKAGSAQPTGGVSRPPAEAGGTGATGPASDARADDE